MTGNENFPSPQPGVDAVQETIDAFFYALSNCSDGDRLKIAIKNQKREALVDVLQQWAYYVLLTAGGDDAIAISSGYEISKSPEPAPPIEKPDAPKLESGLNPGELVSKGKPVSGAVTYLHQYTTEVLMAADNWQSVACSKSTCLLTNLEPGDKILLPYSSCGP